MRLVFKILILALLITVVVMITSRAQTNITYKAATSYNSDSTVVRNQTALMKSLYTNIGAMYYNRITNKWRVWQDTAWYDLVNVSGVFPRYGSNTQIPFMNNNGNFSYSPSFIRDTVNNNYYAVSGLTITNTGTKNNNFLTGQTIALTGTGNIRWLNAHGEALTVAASSTGVIHNAYIYGSGNSITNSSTFGLFSPTIGPGVTQSTITLNGSATAASNAMGLYSCRTCTAVNANVSFGIGYRANITNWGTFAGGYATTYNGATHTGTVQPTTSSGLHAFNWSANSTTSVVNEGARGAYSAILGGVNGDASGIGSVVLGGMDLKNPYDSTVMVPRFNIKSTPTLNNAATRLLAQNSTTGNIEYRDASSLGASLTSTEIAYGSAGNTITSEPALNYNATSNILTVTNVTSSFVNNSGTMYAADIGIRPTVNTTAYTALTTQGVAQTDPLQGQFTVRSASGNNSLGSDNGVDMFVLAGSGVVNGNGGNLTIRSGARAGVGTAGNITLDRNSGHLIILNIPTSSAGLPSGAVWSNAGVLTIVP
jgi:hypothetical protein